MARAKRRSGAKAGGRDVRPEEPWQWQERHAPTEPVQLRETVPARPAVAAGGRRVVYVSDGGTAGPASARARRRVSDADLIRALSAEQWSAAQQIEAAHRALVAVVGLRTSSVETRVDASRGGGQAGGDPRSLRLVAFARACTEARVDYDIAVAVICDGLPFAAAERRAGRARGKGWAVGQVRAACDLWLGLRHGRAARFINTTHRPRAA